MATSVPIFEDELADRIWAARRQAQPLGPIDPIGVGRGERVGTELYAALRRTGAVQIGWKLAFTDAAAQARFHADGPFSAPVFDSSVLAGPRLRRSALIAPLLEAEIAMVVDGSGSHPAACIEIADCRFPDWRVSTGEALADFGLQGAMRFGGPRPDLPTGDVHVVVRHDRTVVAEGSRTIDAARDQLRWLEGQLGDALRIGATTLVATGSLIKPIPLTAGRWELDFGTLGTMDLEVMP